MPKSRPLDRKPYCCPVCGGRGRVPASFYDKYAGQGTVAESELCCRACKGTGVLWSQ